MKPDQERVKNLLTDTVSLLCKNGLQYQKELKVQGLLGITLDNNEVFLIHINEQIGQLIASSETSVTASNDSNAVEFTGTSNADEEPELDSEDRLGENSRRPGQPNFVGKRPMRPALRPFGANRSARDALHRVRKPSSSPGISGSANTASRNSTPLRNSNDDRVQDSRGNDDRGREGGSDDEGNDGGRPQSVDLSRVKVKHEEEDDDDLMIIEPKPFMRGGDDNVEDDRRAMLGSYVSEPSVSEAHLAQNIFSEYAAITSHGSSVDNGLSQGLSQPPAKRRAIRSMGPGLGGNSSGNDSGEGGFGGGGTFVTGLSRNFSAGGNIGQMAQGDDQDLSNSMLDSSLGGWDGQGAGNDQMSPNGGQMRASQSIGGLQQIRPSFPKGYGQVSTSDPISSQADGLFYCSHPSCGCWFKYVQSLKRHEDAKHNKRQYVCDQPGCKKIFTYDTSLMCHKMKAHGGAGLARRSQQNATFKM